MNKHEETFNKLKEITKNLPDIPNYKSKVLLMEIYDKEQGNGFSAYCIDENNAIFGIDADIDYEFSFNEKIAEWHKETSIRENRWNKAEFTVYKDGRYEVKTWWDSEFQISLYGEDN